MSALDTVIRKLESELDERKSAYEAILSHADKQDREPNESEKSTLSELTNRMSEINDQLVGYDATEKVIGQFSTRAKQLDQAIMSRRAAPEGLEYRSAGHFVQDYYRSFTGDRQAQERLDVYSRAAAHQKTSDNLGLLPDPIVGSVVDFIDSRRPITSAIGPKPLTNSTWHRPVVTQRPAVAVQGSAGAAADEKTELVSQKMTITRLTANAVTYGGYLNVSRQNIDFSNGEIVDQVIEGLAKQFAIETEQAVGTELDASTATAVGYGASPTAATIRSAIWAAVADIDAATPGNAGLVLALASDRLEVFGPLFAPITGVTEDGEGLRASGFGSGLIGQISGIPVVKSSGLASGKAFLFSTDAIEVYEQRVGALQVVEPSVAGVQIGYVGYFTPLTIDDGGIIELTAT